MEERSVYKECHLTNHIVYKIFFISILNFGFLGSISISGYGAPIRPAFYAVGPRQNAPSHPYPADVL